MLIVVLEKEEHTRQQLVEVIGEVDSDSAVYTFADKDLLVNWLDETGSLPDAILFDFDLLLQDSERYFAQLRERTPTSRFILMGNTDSAESVAQVGIDGYLDKDFAPNRIREQLDAVRNYQKQRKKLKILCFGNFEAFADGAPLEFRYRKTKELLAYLVDRKGAASTTAELCAILWEDKEATASLKNQFRNLLSDLNRTLESKGLENAIRKQRNRFAINQDYVDCDYYRFLSADPEAVLAYRGEYMVQYSWAEGTLGSLS